MTIENDSDCAVKWTPAVIAIFISLGLMLLFLSEIAPLDKASEYERTGKVITLAGLIAIPIHIIQRRNRCRTVITDEGADFLPATIYGKYSFLWSEVRSWSWVTLCGGSGEDAWVEKVMELELHQGTAIQIPQQHFHPALTNALEQRVNPAKHQQRSL